MSNSEFGYAISVVKLTHNDGEYFNDFQLKHVRDGVQEGIVRASTVRLNTVFGWIEEALQKQLSTELSFGPIPIISNQEEFDRLKEWFEQLPQYPSNRSKY